MLLETMKSLILAGNHALQATCGLQVHCESVNQVRHGSLTFPSLGAVKITRGALQKIHVGCNSDLATMLTGLAVPDTGETGAEVLLNNFLRTLLDEMDSRNPKGEALTTGLGTTTLYTRGVRTFGFRLETERGHLFLLAEVPSRLEFEQARGSDFLETMVSTFLPQDWVQRECIDSKTVIEGFLVFLRKAEGDVELEFPIGDGEYAIHSGLLLETCRVDEKRAVKMSVDLAALGGHEPQVGDEVVARFGLQDRSLRFRLPYLGRSSFPVAGEASLDCVLFEIPEEIVLEQRRRAFRISVNKRIPVEIEDLEQISDPFHPSFGLEAEPLVVGHLADLSFSGARIISETDLNSVQLPEGTRVTCRLFFPDRPGGHAVQGIIRRATSSLVGRDRTVAELGVEFLVTPDMDRTAIEVVRQFVLAEQRGWLARRVGVPA